MFSEALGPVAGARWTRQHGTQAVCHLSADPDSVVRNLLSKDAPLDVSQEDSSSGSFRTLWGCCS